MGWKCASSVIRSLRIACVRGVMLARATMEQRDGRTRTVSATATTLSNIIRVTISKIINSSNRKVDRNHQKHSLALGGM